MTQCEIKQTKGIVANIDSAAPEAESSCKLKLSWVCEISFGEADLFSWRRSFFCMGFAYISRLDSHVADRESNVRFDYIPRYIELVIAAALRLLP